MTRVRSIGIDLSSQGTGLVALESVDKSPPLCWLEIEVTAPKLKGMARYRDIVTRTMEALTNFQPDRIVVEGYSLNLKHASSVVPLCELGGILRLMLHLDGSRWLDPRAGELKKFVCGTGNANKNQVMMMVLKRWGHTSKTDNTADAFALACMGLAHAGALPGITKDQLAIIGALPWRDC